MKIQVNDIDKAIDNLKKIHEVKNAEALAVKHNRIIRGEAQKVQILQECSVLEILSDTAKFGKDNFFDELGEFKPLRWYQPKRMFEAATFLMSIIRQISQCFK